MWQGELALKNVELAAASQEAEKLLREISESTTIAEKEKAKVAVILDQVSATAAVRSLDGREFDNYVACLCISHVWVPLNSFRHRLPG